MLIDKILGRKGEGDGADAAGMSDDRSPVSGFPVIDDDVPLDEASLTTVPPAGSGAGAGTFGTDTVTHAGSGLVFVNTYGAGVTTAFHNAIVSAETYLETHFTNAITIHASFDLQALNHAFSGENSFGGVSATYQQIVNALQAHATSPDDTAAVTKLQSMADPSGGQLFFVPNAQAKLLGLSGTTNGTDDTVILNNFYWNDTSITANPGDAMGVLMHELTEGAMGRIGGRWAMMDLFRYTATGQLDDTGGQDGKLTYFSPDGQNINTGLQFHNPINSSGQDDGFDWADWDQVGQDANAHDPFGPGGPGAGDPGTLSATDLKIMDVLGWTLPGPTVTYSISPSPATINENSGTFTFTVTRSDASQAATVFVSTVQDQGFTNNNNYTNILDQQLNFAGGQSTAQVQLSVNDLGLTSGSETYRLIIQQNSTDPTSTYLATDNFTIVNNDTPQTPPTPSVTPLTKNDFNHDGTSDLLWRNANTGEIDIWFINNNQLSASTVVGTLSTAWQIAGVGDFNGDGAADILFRNTSTGDVRTWEMNGASVANDVTVAAGVPAAWVISGVGDFNGDGKSDLLWRNTTTGEVDTWFINNGHYTGGTALYGSVPSAWQVVGIGDFNGDGQSDILWRNTVTNEVDTWFINNGLYAGGTAVNFVPSAWQIVGIGDFNGDGTSDLLWRNTATGEVDNWLINNGHWSGGAALGFVSSTTQVVGTGNYNGDTKADILLQASDGTPQIWTVNDTTVTATTTLANPGQNWHAITG